MQKIRVLFAAALSAAALALSAAPALAGPGPTPTPKPTCYIAGWYDPNVLCRTGKPEAHVSFRERWCAVLSRKIPTVYRTDPRCVQYAPLLVRGHG